MIAIIVGLVVSLILVVYIAVDAPKHGKNPWGWGLFVFFFYFLALGIYLLRTDRKASGIFWCLVYAVLEVFYLSHGRLLL